MILMMVIFDKLFIFYLKFCFVENSDEMYGDFFCLSIMIVFVY